MTALPGRLQAAKRQLCAITATKHASQQCCSTLLLPCCCMASLLARATSLHITDKVCAADVCAEQDWGGYAAHSCAAA